jgi:hypothetical protein
MPSSRGCSRSKTRAAPSKSGNVARAAGSSPLPYAVSIPAAASPVGSSRDPSCGVSTSSPARPQFDGGTSCSTTWTFSCSAPPIRFRASVISATSASFCSGLRPANHSTCTTTIDPVLLLRDDGPAVPMQQSLPEVQNIRARGPGQARCGRCTGCVGLGVSSIMGGDPESSLGQRERAEREVPGWPR